MNSRSSNNPSYSSLVHKLVCHILQKPSDAVKSEYRTALQELNCFYSNYECNESVVCDKINRKFMQEGRVNDALTFAELHRKLQTSSVLKNRVSVLHFLYCLFGSERDKAQYEQFANNLSKLDSFDANLAVNSHDVVNKHKNKFPSTVDLGDFFIKSSSKNSLSESYISKHSYKHSSRKNVLEPGHSKVACMASMLSINLEKHTYPQSNPKNEPEKALSARSDESNLGSVSFTSPNLQALLRDILYAFQGLRGEIIHWEPEKNNFNVVFKEDFTNPIKKMALRFIELGWMYWRINQYCIRKSTEKSHGLIVQSFVAALKSKLTDYYKLIAELEALLLQGTSLEHASTMLTLHQMSVWIFEPHFQLKILVSVVDACEGKKGGALASVLYSHMQHGDPLVQSLIQNLFKDATRPLIKMLSSWIYCGELDDPFSEFFVRTNITKSEFDLWRGKYTLNPQMIPSFIPEEQANKVMSTGKAINFLHHVCQDSSLTRDDDRRIRALELMNAESLFCQEKDGNFESILEKNYIKTSRRVLQILYDKYNLMDHMMAMRNYFLLGQGDFIRHLIDLLDYDLSKPGKSLYIHNLSGKVESAIRATNAQFHNEEVLQRLDVKLLEVSVGDTGWDVFSLEYHIMGPITTIFTPKSMNSYSRLFCTLFKLKRMEYILSKISRSSTTYSKLQAKIPEVTPVLYQSHNILAQMVHFVYQMQYYMAFEVMECSWADLLTKISSAKDLDEVIEGHEKFLSTLLTRALLELKSVHTQLKVIYDLIIQFDQTQAKFWKEVETAIDSLNEMNRAIKENTDKDGWGITEKQRKEYMEPLNQLKRNRIAATKADLQVLSRSYEEMVQRFLIMLNETDSQAANLHFLSFRLDFNEYYKKRNSRLQTSLTYHRRKSINVLK